MPVRTYCSTICACTIFSDDIFLNVAKGRQKREVVTAFIAATLTIAIVLGCHYLRVTYTSPRKMITVRVTAFTVPRVVIKNAFRKT